MNKEVSGHAVVTEAIAVGVLALGLYFPFLSIQYDTNGIAEAVALEAGQLINKNHMLYRPIGLLVYRALQHFGYAGNSLTVLQTINAICGAAGVGLGYAVFKWGTRQMGAAVAGSLFLATSFMYWVFSTDAAYLPLAAAFVLAAIVCIVYSRSWRGVVLASLFTSLSILTWQANMFVVPAMMVLLMLSDHRPVVRHLVTFVAAVGMIVGCVYIITAFESHGLIGPAALWTWFTNYSENGTLPMWGVWSLDRTKIAAVSAVNSTVPILLAVRPGDITASTQLGRIAVDIALIALTVLFALAAFKIRLKSLWFLFGYLLFVPFIVWWDPFPPVWFLIPNTFLAGFISCGLEPWLRRKYIGPIIALCILVIAGANFVTTIRPRHFLFGPDRTMAQCVAEQMNPRDMFLAVQWGWPDYLTYVHGRTVLNLINETAGAGSKEKMLPTVKAYIASREQQGGSIYMTDPRSYPESHLAWLRAQTGLTLDDLAAFHSLPDFTCFGKTIDKLIEN